MIGWTHAGNRVILTNVQNERVQALLDWDRERSVILPPAGSLEDQVTAMETALRYLRARQCGRPGPDMLWPD
jgi:hypothetical protein